MVSDFKDRYVILARLEYLSVRRDKFAKFLPGIIYRFVIQSTIFRKNGIDFVKINIIKQQGLLVRLACVRNAIN